MIKFRRIQAGATEFFLGTGLGFGYLTAFRFAGPIGVPEIMVLCSLLLLMKQYPSALFNANSKMEKNIKIYLLFAIVILCPLVTAIIIRFGGEFRESAPEYIFAFIMNLFLMIWVTESIREGLIDMRRVTFWFAFAFIFSNIVVMYFGIDAAGAEEARYRGGAKNPNQLTFYAATLSLLLVVFLRRFALFIIPIIVSIILLVKSDAYTLALVAIVASYLYFKLLFSRFLPISFRTKIVVSVFTVLLIGVFAVSNFSSELAEIWLAADEGDGRRYLMSNALSATLVSPLFGFGAGSFSGVDMPFSGSEAHNTFLDFSMQFGIFFPTVLYAIIFIALVRLLKKREFLVAAFVVAFIESGLFHFSGRHFTFWVELAVFWQYAFPRHSAKNSVFRPQFGFVRS